MRNNKQQYFTLLYALNAVMMYCTEYFFLNRTDSCSFDIVYIVLKIDITDMK